MKCPGQDTQYWKPGAIYEVRCPQCDQAVEFFKDDTTRRCTNCNHRFANPKMDFGCAAYCQYAEQCLGTLPEEVLAERDDLLKDRVAVEMKRHFRTDFGLIGRASRRARHAERIGREERGNLAVILTAAYLYEIGIPEARRNHGDGAEGHRGTEGRPLAEALLQKLGAPPPVIEAVGEIVAADDRPGEEATVEEAIVADARRIVQIEDDRKQGRSATVDPDRFRTDAGRRLAAGI